MVDSGVLTVSRKPCSSEGVNVVSGTKIKNYVQD